MHIHHPNDFNVIVDLTDSLNEMLNRRNKIVHKSQYYQDFTEKWFNNYAFLYFSWASNFDYFFNDNGYWDKLDKNCIDNK